MSDTVTPLSLSQAMRLGSMLRPQAFGDYQDGQGTCALAAAYEAVNQDPENDDGGDPFGGIPERVNQRCQCPACKRIEYADDCGFAMGYVIAHLNDDHRWTREQIADWVETIEAQQAQSSSTVNVLDQVAVPV